jgi:hypothetical protein
VVFVSDPLDADLPVFSFFLFSFLLLIRIIMGVIELLLGGYSIESRKYLVGRQKNRIFILPIHARQHLGQLRTM